MRAPWGVLKHPRREERGRPALEPASVVRRGPVPRARACGTARAPRSPHRGTHRRLARRGWLGHGGPRRSWASWGWTCRWTVRT